jgi:hypothetical protein
MVHGMPTGELKDQLSLYVLDLLDAEQAAEIAMHLASGCSICEREVAGLRETIGALGLQTARPKPRRVWDEVAAGVSVKRLHADAARDSATIELRFAEGGWYTRARCVTPEQCYVLEGVLYDGDHRLEAGEYHCSPEDTPARLLRSETGCVVLIVTSFSDELAA